MPTSKTIKGTIYVYEHYETRRSKKASTRARDINRQATDQSCAVTQVVRRSARLLPGVPGTGGGLDEPRLEGVGGLGGQQGGREHTERRGEGSPGNAQRPESEREGRPNKRDAEGASEHSSFRGSNGEQHIPGLPDSEETIGLETHTRPPAGQLFPTGPQVSVEGVDGGGGQSGTGGMVDERRPEVRLLPGAHGGGGQGVPGDYPRRNNISVESPALRPQHSTRGIPEGHRPGGKDYSKRVWRAGVRIPRRPAVRRPLTRITRGEDARHTRADEKTRHGNLAGEVCCCANAGARVPRGGDQLSRGMHVPDREKGHRHDQLDRQTAEGETVPSQGPPSPHREAAVRTVRRGSSGPAQATRASMCGGLTRRKVTGHEEGHPIGSEDRPAVVGENTEERPALVLSHERERDSDRDGRERPCLRWRHLDRVRDRLVSGHVRPDIRRQVNQLQGGEGHGHSAAPLGAEDSRQGRLISRRQHVSTGLDREEQYKGTGPHATRGEGAPRPLTRDRGEGANKARPGSAQHHSGRPLEIQEARLGDAGIT
ncbi:hypothetical protein J8273_7629, partial [Carpediemonas membranifera]